MSHPMDGRQCLCCAQTPYELASCAGLGKRCGPRLRGGSRAGSVMQLAHEALCNPHAALIQRRKCGIVAAMRNPRL